MNTGAPARERRLGDELGDRAALVLAARLDLDDELAGLQLERVAERRRRCARISRSASALQRRAPGGSAARASGPCPRARRPGCAAVSRTMLARRRGRRLSSGGACRRIDAVGGAALRAVLAGGRQRAAARTAGRCRSTERPLISATAPPRRSAQPLAAVSSSAALDAHRLRARRRTRAACRRRRGRRPSPRANGGMRRVVMRAAGRSTLAPSRGPATRRRLRMRAASSSMRPAQR